MSSVWLPRVLRMGGGARHSVGEVLRDLHIKNPIIVTDNFLAMHTNFVDELQTVLSDSSNSTSGPAAVFHDTVADPTISSVLCGLEVVKQHSPDAIIAIGGGSPIDTAKAMAAPHLIGIYKNNGHVSDDRAVLPVIAIPTTAGTGSEVTRFCVVTDEAKREKRSCGDVRLQPVAAIVDYEYTMSAPARLTADTGIDALVHAVEAYVSRRHQPFTDAMALHAVRSITRDRALQRAYANGMNDHEARQRLMEGATYAGIAFSNASVGLVHGMSRPLGAHFRLTHGMGNAILFPDVTEFSLESAIDRYATIAREIDVSQMDKSDEAAANALVAFLRELNRELDVPSFAEHGVDRTQFDDLAPLMAQQALASGSPKNNPRIPSVAEIEQLYAQIYDRASNNSSSIQQSRS